MQNAFVRFQMKAYLFYHAQQALSRTFLTFFEAFQLQTSFSQFFRNFLSRFAILPDSLFIIPHPDSLVNIFFHPLSSFFCPRRRPSRCSLISIRHSHPLVNSFFCFSTSFCSLHAILNRQLVFRRIVLDETYRNGYVHEIRFHRTPSRGCPPDPAASHAATMRFSAYRNMN